MRDDVNIRPRNGVKAKQVELTIGFDLVAYRANPGRLRNGENGERPIGSALMGDKLVVLWPNRIGADTYLPGGLRGLRLAVVNELEDCQA